MFLKAQNKILKEDNSVEMKTVLVEMEDATTDTPQEERTRIYYEAVRKAINIISDKGKYILMGGMNEVVDCKLSEDKEYNLLVKSTADGFGVNSEDIYILK